MWEIILVCAALAGPNCIAPDLSRSEFSYTDSEQYCEFAGQSRAIIYQNEIGYPLDFKCIYREDLEPPIDYEPQRVD